MNCQEAKDLIKPFLDGDLDRNAMQQVRRHLAACRECASGLDPQDLMEILPVLDDSIEPSEDFTDRFYAALETGASRQSSPERLHAADSKRSGLPRWSWSLAAAAVLTVVVSTSLFFRQSQYSIPDVEDVLYDFEMTENLHLLRDMELLSNLELIENLDTIENLQ